MSEGSMFSDTLGTEEEQVERINAEIKEKKRIREEELSRMSESVNKTYSNRVGSDSEWHLDEVTKGVSDDGKIKEGVKKSPVVKEYIEDLAKDLAKELKKKKSFMSSVKRLFIGKKPINNIRDMDEYTRTNKKDVFNFYKQGARVGGSKIKRNSNRNNKKKNILVNILKDYVNAIHVKSNACRSYLPILCVFFIHKKIRIQIYVTVRLFIYWCYTALYYRRYVGNRLFRKLD
jgi:hypothetical protein